MGVRGDCYYLRINATWSASAAMIRARISRFKDKAKAAVGFKKKSTLQAPAMAKKVIRCAIRRRSRALYLVFLSWPFILIFLASVVSAALVTPRSDVPWWLFKAQVWLAAALSLTKALDRGMYANSAWKRRGR